MAKPIVDGLENELQGRARVMRLNVLDSVGMNAARRFEVRVVPTFIVFDGQGGVVETQIGIPNRAKIVLAVDALSR